MKTPLRVLLVEDSETDAELLRKELLRGGFEPEIKRVETAADFTAALDRESWDAVISDAGLPRFNGLEALAIARQRGPDVPFLLLSGSIDEAYAVAAMDAGAHDVVHKDRILRLVPALRRELKDAEERRERRRAEERLQRNALHDALTGLPNRALFMDRLGLALLRAQRHEEFRFAVLFVDLDRFKVVIDSMGHAVGDQLLVEIARRLETCIRPGDTVARLGGDEFTVLLEDVRDLGDPARIAERTRKAVASPFRLEGREAVLTASVGIAFGDSRTTTAEDLLRNANTAMHRAKDGGKDRHEIFDDAMHARAVERLQVETDLRRALERGELRMHYQPIVSLVTGRLTGFEALMRWTHPVRGPVGPNVFIPVAEESGLILPLGRLALREACAAAMTWRKRLPAAAPLSMAVNLSGRQFAQPDLADEIGALLRESGLDPSRLHLEITESAVMADPEAAAAVLRRLRDLGVRFSIDDFGTGYSSLALLHRIPVDLLKIDRSFVSRMSGGSGNLEVVRAIVALAHALRLEIVAEGVETAEQLALLRALGCESAQGFLFAKALPPEEAEALIARGPAW